MYGFTVDDALIVARYASNIAHGAGYRLNAGGPVTDGVTPLGFAFLLAPFARSGPLAALAAAKILGVTAWMIGASLLGAAMARRATTPRALAFALVLCSAPMAAWSVAGMETGLVIGLTASAVALRSLGAHAVGAALVGLAAGLRPELLPFAAIVALAPEPEARWPARFGRLALATAPFFAVAVTRALVFGRAAPLSALAKAPDLGLGLKYALACLLLTGPLALIAPRAWLRLGPLMRGMLLAIVAHLFAIALAGGDWMPLSRLVAPVLPCVALVASSLERVSSRRSVAARMFIALAGQLYVLARVGPPAAAVGAERRALVEELAPSFAGSSVVAAVDIGWLGAATSATIVDLAGVTDPAIAALPGGHTSKRLAPDLLDRRGVDTLVLLLAPSEPVAQSWTESRFSRAVERRVASFPGIAAHFTPLAVSETKPSLRYLVLRRVPAPPAE